VKPQVLLAFVFAVASAVVLSTPALQRPLDTLPAQYTDAEFWSFVMDFSEPGGSFPYENFVSNERNFQVVIPEVKRRRANLQALPVESTGLFIRFMPQSTLLRSIRDVPASWPGRNW
jgi:hypothetical protein